MGKLIFVLLDACGYQAATDYAGYLEHCTEAKLCAKYKVRGELPSMSRVMYSTLMSGLTSSEHGVTGNMARGLLKPDNLFSMCRAQGLVTAAAAYFWMSELFNKETYDIHKDRFQLNSSGQIQHGIFYSKDSYPDEHLFADGEFLRREFRPDFLLIHPMNIDWEGHQHCHGSIEHTWAVANSTETVGLLLPRWLEDGYDVIITADHGMDEKGVHGGTTQIQRNVPLYVFSKHCKKGDFTNKEVSHLNVAPLACKLLGIQPAAGMAALTEISLN